MQFGTVFRGGSRTAATPKMERLVIIVNVWKPLTIITKRSILDVAAVLDQRLVFALLVVQAEVFQNFAPYSTEIGAVKTTSTSILSA